MYLKNIEVHGFKSFAQKINFEFHNGITAIVGPNGSGKSNVGDAVRWVLGEQSAKQLRGGNMQDVIFSGTETRKPLSYASVAITLDNSDHVLPVDFNEVTIARRLYRSGESEYLINGSACRLRDINEMFYDTGIGKEGYSIIGQGQIDRILSGKPEERRELFDEAAGIVKFKRRKNTTIKKLEEEQQNLVRVTDILSELTKQLGPLERQSETARVYLSKRDSLRRLDVNLFLMEYERTGKLLEELEEKNNLSQGELTQCQAAYDETKEKYERLEEELTELIGRIDALREESQSNALKKQELEGRIDVFKEQMSAIVQNEEHYKMRLGVIQDELDKKADALKAQEDEKRELHVRLREIRQSLSGEEEHLTSVRSSIDECAGAVEEGKNEIIEILNSRANTKGKAQRFDTMLEQIDIQKAGVSQRLLRLKSEEEELGGAMKKARAQYDSITELMENMNKECIRLEEQVFQIQEELKRQNAQMEIGQTAYHREESRLESLRNITERYDGYGNSIRRCMEQKERVPGVRGVVADLIQVDKRYEIAIETALGGSIQNIVTDNEQTAKQMIEFLKKNRYGRATFLPLSSISARGGFSQKDALRETGVVGIASELVTTQEQYRELASYLLGRVLVVDTMEHAIAIARKYRYSLRMVTVEGELLSPGGSMTGGAFKNSSNLLGRRREMEELEASVKALKKDMQEMQKSIDDNRSKRNVIRDTIADFKEKLRQQSVAQNTAKMQISQLEEKEAALKSGYAGIEREQRELQRQVSEVKEDHRRITQELLESQKDEKELETFIETRQKELDGWKEEESNVLKKLEAIRLEASALEHKENFAQENYSRIHSEIQTLGKEKEEIAQSLLSDDKEMEQKKEEIESLLKTVDAFAKQEMVHKKQLEEWQKEKEEQSGRQKGFFQQRDELSSRISLLDKECFRLKSQMEKTEESRESSVSYMWEEYEVTPNNARQYRDEELVDAASMKKEISGLKEEIRRLGPVNVNAIEDYKELLERHTFLAGQYEDLQKAEETLQNIIRELDEGMRRQFSEKFKDIQWEFDKAFKELFGGGKGTLELSEEEDILEAGIKIISQPPGKKLQNMMQLSGGGEGAHSHCAFVCHSELKAIAVLSFRRDRGGA